MDWKTKIYESLVTEKRSEASRRRTSLRKRGAEMDKRKAAGKSIGAYGAGTRARTAKAQARQASKPSAWYARRHHEDEAARLIAHGKQYKANQDDANKAKRSPSGSKMSKKTAAAKARAVSENVYDLKATKTATPTVGNKLPAHILDLMDKAKAKSKKKRK